MNYKGLYKTQNMPEIDKINLYVEGKGILGMWENDEDLEKDEVEDTDTEKEMKWKKEEPKEEEDNEEKSNIKSITKEENKRINYSLIKMKSMDLMK